MNLVLDILNKFKAINRHCCIFCYLDLNFILRCMSLAELWWYLSHKLCAISRCAASSSS